MYARALARRCFSCTATARAAVLENFFEAVDGIGVTPHGGFTWFESFHFKAARKIREKLKRCDVVIEVRDARVPFSSYNTELEKLTLGKPRMVVFNKADLADADANRKLLSFYEALGVPCLLTNFSGLNARDAIRVAGLAESLRDHKTMVEAPTICLVVGMPNVGKSSIIVSLRRSFVDELTDPTGFRHRTQKRMLTKRTRVGGNPGVTRKVGIVQIPAHKTIGRCVFVDTPGILFPKVTNLLQAYKVAVTGLADYSHQISDSVLVEKVGDIMYKVIVAHGMEASVMAHFRLAYPPPQTYREFTQRAVFALDLLTKATGRSLKFMTQEGFNGSGMEAEFRKAGRLLLNAFRIGKFGRITLDEIPELHDGNVVEAKPYIQKLYEEEKERRFEREQIMRAQRLNPTKTDDDENAEKVREEEDGEKLRVPKGGVRRTIRYTATGEEVVEEGGEDEPASGQVNWGADPGDDSETLAPTLRVWDIKSRTVADHTAEGREEHTGYKLEKMVKTFKTSNASISRVRGPLRGTLGGFDDERFEDVRVLKQKQSTARSEELDSKYRMTRYKRGRHLNADPDDLPKIGKLVRIRTYANPNHLNSTRDINILTGDAKINLKNDKPFQEATQSRTFKGPLGAA